MRAAITVLLVVVGVGNAADLGIPPASRMSFVPARAAEWQWYKQSPTGEKLCAGGAALLWGSTMTSLTLLPLLKEPQQRKLYLPLGCAYLGGAALYLAGKLVARRQARAEHQ
jgi:hypothetical protein